MGGLRTECDAERIDVDLALDRVGIDLGDQPLVQDAGVVVEDVELPAGRLGELAESVCPLC